MTPQHDIVEHRHAAEERDVLERAGDAEHGDLRWAGAGDVLALEDDRAGVGPVEPADHVEEGSLAGAVWANDRDEPAAAAGERHTMQRPPRAEMLSSVGNGELRLA